MALEYKDRYLSSRATISVQNRDPEPDTLKKLIANGASLDVKDNRGFYPLHDACCEGSLDCVKSLTDWSSVKNCINTDDFQSYLNEQSFEGYTPVFLSASGGKSLVLRHLLQLGASVDACDLGRKTPLAIAAENGKEECVKVCLEFGADVNAASLFGETALHHAAFEGHLACFQHLLAADNINVDATTKDTKMTPLMVSAMLKRTHFCKLLIGKGADVNKPNIHGLMSLHFACTKGKDEELTETLLRNGADINAHCTPETAGLETPLELAIYTSSYPCVKVLLEHGAMVKFGEEPHFSILQLVDSALDIENDRARIVKILLEYSADLKDKQELWINGFIGRCIEDNDLEMMGVFMDKYEIQNNPQMIQQILTSAIRFRNYEVINFLLERGGKNPEFPSFWISMMIKILRKNLKDDKKQNALEILEGLLKLNTRPVSMGAEENVDGRVIQTILKYEVLTEDLAKGVRDRHVHLQGIDWIPSLKHYCRVKIRRMLPHAPDKSTFKECCLPEELVKYIMFE